MPKRIVIELTQVSVEPPLTDGARARDHKLGVFSAMETATAWLAQQIAEESVGGDDTDYALLYYVADEIVLDIRLRCSGTTVFNRDGSTRGVIPGGIERPWGGRPASECRFTAGDLVGFVYDERYRIGIVLAQPSTPEEGKRWGELTLGDDVYLVGVLDKDGNPECNDHDHVAECQLFPVEHEIPSELRAALGKRFENSGWAKVPA